MKQERNVTKGAIIVFKESIAGGDLEKLKNQNYSDVVINGDLIIDKNLEFVGNLYVTGKILSASNDVTILGSLYCEGEVYGKEINVNGDFCVDQLLYAKGIRVKGDLIACGNIINEAAIKVWGTLKCNAKIISKNICVAGSIYCQQYMDAKHSNIDVAGDLECRGAIEANNIHVLGKMNVFDGIMARKIKIGY